MVDGVSGAELMAVVLDSERNPELGQPEEWRPERQPTAAELAVHALAARTVSPYEQLRAVRSALRSPRRVAGSAATTARGLWAMAGIVSAPPASSLNGPIGPHRRWAWARSALSDVKRVRSAFGGTVNDVVLTSIAGGFRALLDAREESTQRDVRTLVPVSVRSDNEHGEYNNRVSAIFANLPVGIADPVERLAVVHGQMEDLKQSGEAVAGDVLVGLSGFAPAMLLALGLRAATRMPQHSVNTVTTNVPGPQHELYAAGRRMLECFPYVPLGGHVRIGVAIFSYNGGLTFGVTGDYDEAPDIEVLCRGIERSMRDLVAAAERSDHASAEGVREGARPRNGNRRRPRPVKAGDGAKLRAVSSRSPGSASRVAGPGRAS
jgi:WS/DGAT/MGAT family acyltransferase